MSGRFLSIYEYVIQTYDSIAKYLLSQTSLALMMQLSFSHSRGTGTPCLDSGLLDAAQSQAPNFTSLTVTGQSTSRVFWTMIQGSVYNGEGCMQP